VTLHEKSLTCVVCGDRLERARGARGKRCGTCSRYFTRHGVDRPVELVIRLTERDIARELMARSP
jgi:hypothetical protein